MIWKNFIDSEIKKLLIAKQNDIQYQNLNSKNLHSIFFKEIAEWLEFKKKIKFEKLLLLLHREIKSSDKKLIRNFISKRLKGLPKDRILGIVSFWNLKIKVNKHTLIPRPETEELARITVEEIKKNREKIELIEIGTGSGCLGLSVIKNIPQNPLTILTDIDSKALFLAQKNSIYNKLKSKKIKFLKSNLLSFIKKEKSIIGSRKELFILANLPYISKKEYTKLSLEVILHEPKKALIGGEKGDEIISRLINQITDWILKKNPSKKITVFIEASPSTIPAIKKHAQKKKLFPIVETMTDLSGKKRFFKLKTMG